MEDGLPVERSRQWHRHSITISLVILIWSGSIFIFSQIRPIPRWHLEEAATVLFGAASVALFLFSILVGALAVLGWQALERAVERATERAVAKGSAKLKKEIETSANNLKFETDKLEKELRSKIELLKLESKGRVFSGLGYMLGEMSIDSETLEMRDKPKLEEALVHCRQGYEILKTIGGGAEFSGLNNLIFYYCVYGDDKHRDFILEQARRLQEASRRNQEPGKEDRATNLQLTACRAIIMYSSDPKEIAEARAALKYFKEMPGSDRIKGEATLILDKFP